MAWKTNWLNIHRLAVILLLLLAQITASSATPPAYIKQQSAKKPIAIGFGEDEKYTLYSNGEVYRLMDKAEMELKAKINMENSSVEESIIDFEIYGENLYLYAYRSLNQSSGKTTITVFSISSGEKIFEKTYEFTVTQENRVNGSMVLAASACMKGLAVITANTTHSILEVYKTSQNRLILSAVYSARIAMSIYRYGDTLLAATFKAEIKDNMPWITPRITDLIENKTLFELPALIPVAALAYPFIQVFNRNGSWECHVTVNNPRMSRIEYYIVYPEKLDLIDSRETVVSTYMDYLVISQPEGSKITFKNGENITVTWSLKIVPQGAQIPIDPKNGILDANPINTTILAKIIEEDRAKIIYVTKKGSKEIYSLSAKYASKIEGFYAALTKDTAYIIDPEKQEIISINLTQLEESSENEMAKIAMIAAASIILAAITLAGIKMYQRRQRKTEVNKGSEKNT